MSIINASIELKDQYKRLQSIPGVGKVLATLMIIKTKGFTEIKSARKMACYSGIAPFEHQSDLPFIISQEFQRWPIWNLRKYYI